MKVNAKQLFVHEIVSQYLNSNHNEANPLLEVHQKHTHTHTQRNSVISIRHGHNCRKYIGTMGRIAERGV